MIYIQNENSPSRVLFSFDDVVSPDLLKTTWSVAYATYIGCHHLEKYISQKISTEVWEECEKDFVISIDYGHTEPNALEYLAQQQNANVYIANSYLLGKGSLQPTNAFHPKVYCFNYEQDARVLSGSANLTKSALHRNVEVVQTQTLDYEQFDINEFATQLRSNAIPLTPQMLQSYKTLRKARPKPEIRIPEKKPSQPNELPNNSNVDWLGAAINSGLNLSSFEYFWIEAGSMSSGGSRNQLELARGSNYFFGFDYDEFINQGPALEIGSIDLTIDGKQHMNRIYRWHSNNMMERLNLPTITQGGVEYRNKCIIFRRRTNDFESLVVDWDSEEALDWRMASTKQNLIYRISQRLRINPRSRQCGFL